MPLLTPDQIRTALGSLDQWRLQSANVVRLFEFKDFDAAMDFVNRVARLAGEADHHPDIDIRWNKVTLALCTHSAGGLTQKDFDLARRIDGLI
jgi:4a-hydroxytetrahydrobiopterin dehydratase